jgi:hypothetical protein
MVEVVVEHQGTEPDPVRPPRRRRQRSQGREVLAHVVEAAQDVEACGLGRLGVAANLAGVALAHHLVPEAEGPHRDEPIDATAATSAAPGRTETLSVVAQNRDVAAPGRYPRPPCGGRGLEELV